MPCSTWDSRATLLRKADILYGRDRAKISLCKSSAILQTAVHDRGKNMQEPPTAGKSVLLIDKPIMFWTQSLV